MQIRVQRIISAAGICSRRKAEELIKKGMIKINGKVAVLGNKADPSEDEIICNGMKVSLQKKLYIMLNKPKGFVTTLQDPFEKKIISDLVKIQERVFPVGRLDKNSEGLLILTNDGEMANRIMHPRFEIKKTYYLELDKDIEKKDLEAIKRGIVIEGIRTSKAIINEITPKKMEITIHEGRKRILRKMLAILGYDVQTLVRVKIGNLSLGNLKEGSFRTLSENDLKLIFG